MFTDFLNNPFSLGRMELRPIDRALRRAREKGMNQSLFAERLGVEPQHITNWKRRGMPPEWHARVAQVLGYTVDELLGLISEVRPIFSTKYPPAPEEDEETLDAVAQPAAEGDMTIPQFDTGGAMGFGFTLQDQPGVIRRWVVSPDWLQQNVHRITSPKNLAIVTGFGDSMRPLYNPGDPLLVDRGITRAEIDGIYFFRVGGEGFVKRLQRIPTVDGMVLRAKSENSQYDSFDIVKEMDFEVFGRVVKAWRGEEF